MPLDPKAKALLDMTAAGPEPDWSRVTITEYRAGTAAQTLPPSTEALASIEDRVIPGPGGDLRVRVYRPALIARLPATLFFHGGGFVACGLDSHDNICRRLSRLSGSVVISVEYRLAPESPFPAAVDDASTALAWVRREALALGIDPRRLALAGDSAGGNLAAVTAQQDRGRDLRHQLLLYPALDPSCTAGSFREYGDAGYLLTTGMMRWFWDQYLPDPRAATDPRAAPPHALELHGVPSATIITAECDPLRDEGEAYAAALERAGVRVRLRRVPGMFHGFASLLGFLEQADRAVADGARALQQAFEENA